MGKEMTQTELKIKYIFTPSPLYELLQYKVAAVEDGFKAFFFAGFVDDADAIVHCFLHQRQLVSHKLQFA